MNKYSLIITERFEKQFKKLDVSVQRTIKKWIDKHLLAADADPRDFGKGLSGNKKGYWRYRIGDYRLLCEILDRELVIIAITVDHRSVIYKK